MKNKKLIWNRKTHGQYSSTNTGEYWLTTYVGNGHSGYWRVERPYTVISVIRNSLQKAKDWAENPQVSDKYLQECRKNYERKSEKKKAIQRRIHA